MYRFVYDKDLERVESEMTGAFRQYPLRLAWAERGSRKLLNLPLTLQTAIIVISFSLFCLIKLTNL
jgi:hypothetical protein